jgi:hypothetical protein
MKQLRNSYKQTRKEVLFNKNICYCNADNIVSCGYKETNRCPKVCRLFSGEDERLEELFTGNNNWREDEK